MSHDSRACRPALAEERGRLRGGRRWYAWMLCAALLAGAAASGEPRAAGAVLSLPAHGQGAISSTTGRAAQKAEATKMPRTQRRARLKGRSAVLDSASSHASSVVEGANKGALASPALVTEDEIADEWDMTTSLKRLGEYVEQHPEFLTAVVFWVLSGNVLLLAGLFIFLFSEIKMVCVVRGRDMRTELLEAQTLNRTAAEHETLTQAEAASVAPRAYLTFLGSVLFFFGVLIALIPLCDVLHLLGLPTGVTCIYILAMEALTCAIVLTFFLQGAVWSCTRPWAAGVLISLSVCGLVLCPTGNVLLLLLFLFLSFSIYMIYFNWYPEYLDQQKQPHPAWLQSIGSLEVRLDQDRWWEAGRVITNSAWAETAQAASALVSSSQKSTDDATKGQ